MRALAPNKKHFVLSLLVKNGLSSQATAGAVILLTTAFENPTCRGSPSALVPTVRASPLALQGG